MIDKQKIRNKVLKEFKKIDINMFKEKVKDHFSDIVYLTIYYTIKEQQKDIEKLLGQIQRDSYYLTPEMIAYFRNIVKEHLGVKKKT